jgi:dCMP deaminase
MVQAHMQVAGIYARLSYARRRQVGCVVVRDDTIVAIGYNGTPPGWDNRCEGEDGQTLPQVIHAEQNALDKITRGSASSVGSTMFVTTAPCIECAKRIFGAGIRKVYYNEVYRSDDGLQFLESVGIETERIENA